MRIWASVRPGNLEANSFIIVPWGIVLFWICAFNFSLNILFSSSVHRMRLIFAMPAVSEIERMYTYNPLHVYSHTKQLQTVNIVWTNYKQASTWKFKRGQCFSKHIIKNREHSHSIMFKKTCTPPSDKHTPNPHKRHLIMLQWNDLTNSLTDAILFSHVQDDTCKPIQKVCDPISTLLNNVWLSCIKTHHACPSSQFVMITPY